MTKQRRATIQIEASVEGGTDTPPIQAFSQLTWVVSFLATLAVAVSVYAYANYAGDLIASVDTRIGENVASEAAKLASMGDASAAIERYREALATRFDDERQHFWTLRTLGELLLKEGKAADAVEVLKQCVTSNPEDSISLGLLARAYRAGGQYADMADVAQQWVLLSAKTGQPATVAAANLHLGEALEKLGRSNDALTAYLAGAKAQPESDCAYQAAVILSGQGENDKAIALLESYLPKATGWRAESAAKLRAALSGKAAP